MSLLEAVEFITAHAGHRAAIYRLCGTDDGDAMPSRQSEDGSPVASDLALLERRARADGFPIVEQA